MAQEASQTLFCTARSHAVALHGRRMSAASSRPSSRYIVKHSFEHVHNQEGHAVHSLKMMITSAAHKHSPQRCNEEDAESKRVSPGVSSKERVRCALIVASNRISQCAPKEKHQRPALPCGPQSDQCSAARRTVWYPKKLNRPYRVHVQSWYTKERAAKTRGALSYIKSPPHVPVTGFHPTLLWSDLGNSGAIL